MKLEDARALAHDLMGEHGLTRKGWTFEFDGALRRFGLCSYRKRTIQLSWRLTTLNPEKEVRNTLLHEIAHALEPEAGHGPRWKRTARSIGCDGNRCHDSTIAQLPLVAHCPLCGKEHQRTRRPKPGRRHSCKPCSRGRFNEKAELVWRRRR